MSTTTRHAHRRSALRAHRRGESGQMLVDLLVAMLLLGILVVMIAPALFSTDTGLAIVTKQASSEERALNLLGAVVRAAHGAQPVGWCPSTPSTAPAGTTDPYGPMTTPPKDCLDASIGPPGQPRPFVTYEPGNPPGSAGSQIPQLPAAPSELMPSSISAGAEAVSRYGIGFYALAFPGPAQPTGTPSASPGKAPDEVWLYVNPGTPGLLVHLVVFAPVCPTGGQSCTTDPTWSFATSSLPCTRKVPTRTCVVVGSLARLTTTAPFLSYVTSSGLQLAPASSIPVSTTTDQPVIMKVHGDFSFEVNGKSTLDAYSASTTLGVQQTTAFGT